MSNYIVGLIGGFITGLLLCISAERYEIDKCEQGGLHCEMRAIPVMELK